MTYINSHLSPSVDEMRAAGLSEVQIYTELTGRVEAYINEWRGLAHEAYKAGDEMRFWEAGQYIKDLERKRDSMRKPTEEGKE